MWEKLATIKERGGCCQATVFKSYESKQTTKNTIGEAIDWVGQQVEIPLGECYIREHTLREEIRGLWDQFYACFLNQEDDTACYYVVSLRENLATTTYRPEGFNDEIYRTYCDLTDAKNKIASLWINTIHPAK